MADRALLSRIVPGSGPLAQRLRLWSGLILFAFVLTHYFNHALGIVSTEWMVAAQDVRRGFWRTPPGTILLYGALIVHVIFGLVRIARRRTLRMPAWEALQIGLVLFIPYQLVAHIIATRGMASAHGVNDDYIHELSILWPSQVLNQNILLLAVWVHGVLGLHFWLRLKPWYREWSSVLLSFAIAIPLLAMWGWIDAARRLELTGLDTGGLTPEQFVWLIEQIDGARWFAIGLLVFVFAIPLIRYILSRLNPSIRITYPGRGAVRAGKGSTLLEISRDHGIPHASVCGGRARCSTCRTLIVEHDGELPAIGDAERKVLDRIEADPRVRLACQLRPTSDLTAQPLLPAGEAAAAAGASHDAYHWGVEKPAVVMFADMRNFTGLAEDRLPYDVVFLLNRYLGLMSQAIEKAGGQVDKFIGDGIMAIFGISDDIKVAARQALDASAAMADALDGLNAEAGLSGDDALRIGVGVHAGPVILGRIGAAGAGGASASITALGDTVNAASRLETASKDLATFLVTSQAVLRAAGVSYEDGRPSTITVKGKRKALDVVAIDDPRALRIYLAEQAV